MVKRAMHTWAEGAVGVVEEAWEGMLASFCSSGQRQALPAFIICHRHMKRLSMTRHMQSKGCPSCAQMLAVFLVRKALKDCMPWSSLFIHKPLSGPDRALHS